MIRPRLAGVVSLLASAPAWAAVGFITNDTYVDSYDASPGVLDNTRTNYGNLGVVKAVTSAGSTDFPLATSETHTLFTLPASFWSDIGAGNVTSAVVEYDAKNNSLAGRPLELHPLLHGFVAGDGGVNSQTQNGAANGTPTTDAVQHGADWVTYDGLLAHKWATAGGDFDAGVTALAVTAGTTAFRFDIAAMINNPIARAEIQANGLLIRTVNELDHPSPQQFASMFSGESAVSGVVRPTITYAVPEPAALGLLGGVTLVLARRRRHA